MRRLRKKWDRLREKSLKRNEPVRNMLLKRLDDTENNLRVLEEEALNRVARSRLMKEVEIELAEISILVKSKQEEIQAMGTQKLPDAGKK